MLLWLARTPEGAKVAIVGLNLIIWMMWSNLSQTMGAITARTGIVRVTDADFQREFVTLQQQ